jgi:succinate dehydrogenase / fumarate reductase, membrane anchor subunit
MAVITRSPVGRVIGMGSTRHGAGMWMKERLSGMALLPLGIWFVVWAVSLSDASYEEVRASLSGPINTTFMVLFVALSFWHSRLGVQVILEDYVHHELWKGVALLANVALHALLGAACVVAALKVSLGS